MAISVLVLDLKCPEFVVTHSTRQAQTIAPFKHSSSYLMNTLFTQADQTEQSGRHGSMDENEQTPKTEAYFQGTRYFHFDIRSQKKLL